MKMDLTCVQTAVLHSINVAYPYPRPSIIFILYRLMVEEVPISSIFLQSFLCSFLPQLFHLCDG